MPKTGLFEPIANPIGMLPETLDLMSRDISNRTFERIMTSSDSNLEDELFEVTQDEVERGWLSEEVPICDLPEDAIVNPRFAIKQGQKLRAIDDYTFSGVNACVGCYEKVYLQGVDDILSLALELCKTEQSNFDR